MVNILSGYSDFLQIRVNSVNPTVVMTELGKKSWKDPAMSGPVLARIPLGRFPGKLDSLKQCLLHEFKQVM